MSLQLPAQLSIAIEVEPGEKLSLPANFLERIGPGHWLITISPFDSAEAQAPVRGHSAFLNTYAPEDEGLYDDFQAR